MKTKQKQHQFPHPLLLPFVYAGLFTRMNISIPRCIQADMPSVSSHLKLIYLAYQFISTAWKLHILFEDNLPPKSF